MDSKLRIVRYLVTKNMSLNQALVLAKAILNQKDEKITVNDKVYKKTKKIV